ncbi:uncharacterized protein CANTADRAFT_24763 [Suhomyces tanzawaensis NRRL Y-17324]|uniref:Uncharacterized protein n=1 Tax=Suhomyces tanzawaensis NRRL Y-17324 TaxID=984487 RepID=A0A1E4SRN0_9ASCO|nr:uncharacterized protein CANTADRAFT_24763 [Suhomyces tanzawaensis NRRL Y-17324]ODV82097.1 hypothetical protein CANTADRAFT_24763 [Suhomyces tanzawaensis NRRL Y-17324]
MVKQEKGLLFVDEEDERVYDKEESPYYQEDEQEEIPDDPIIDSIPLVMNTLSSRSTQSLHVLQYPGRPKTRPLDQEEYRAAVKEESNYLEVRLPLDTNKFFNANKVEEWGETIGEQTLNGVLDKTDGGYYVGQIVKDGDSRKIVLVPVDSTTQLRPSFKYIDDIDQMAQTQRRAEASEANKNTNFQILQSSAKSSSQITNTEGFGNALGESLRHVKKFDEEEWSHLKWTPTQDELAQTTKEQLRNGGDGVELTTATTFGDYINELTRA